MISNLFKLIFDDVLPLLAEIFLTLIELAFNSTAKQKLIMFLILTIMSSCFYYSFTLLTAISLLPIAKLTSVKVDALKVIPQNYPDRLEVLKDFEHEPIGSLAIAGKFVANSSFALLFVHAGNWHYPSVEIGRRLSNLKNSSESGGLSVPLISINCQYKPGQCHDIAYTKKIPSLWLYHLVDEWPIAYTGDYSESSIESFVKAVKNPTLNERNLLPAPFKLYKISFITKKKKISLSKTRFRQMLKMVGEFHDRNVKFVIEQDENIDDQVKLCQIADSTESCHYHANWTTAANWLSKKLPTTNLMFSEERVIQKPNFETSTFTKHENVKTVELQDYLTPDSTLLAKISLFQSSGEIITPPSYKRLYCPFNDTVSMLNEYGEVLDNFRNPGRHSYTPDYNTFSAKFNLTKLQVKKVSKNQQTLMNKSTIPQVRKYGYVKNNSTVAGIQIIENLDHVINLNSNSKHRKLNIIWFHKMGNQFSASNFAVPLLKLSNKYRKCDHLFQVLKYICSAKNYHEEAIRPQHVPSIAIYDSVSGKSVEIFGRSISLTSSSNLFKLLVTNVYEFTQVHQFNEARKCLERHEL